MSLALANLLGVALFKELRGDLEEPFGVDSAHFTHVLLRGLHQLVIYDPLRSLVEQRARWVNEHLLVVTDRLVALSWILATAMVEETSTNRLPNLCVVLELETATGDDREAEAFHDRDELLPDVLAPLHSPGLDEVLIAPLVLEAMHLPGLVNG